MFNNNRDDTKIIICTVKISELISTFISTLFSHLPHNKSKILFSYSHTQNNNVH